MRFISVTLLAIATFATAAPVILGTLPNLAKDVDNRVQKGDSDAASIKRGPIIDHPSETLIANDPATVLAIEKRAVEEEAFAGRDPSPITPAIISLLDSGLRRRGDAYSEILHAREPIGSKAIISLAGGGLGRRAEAEDDLEERGPISSTVLLTLAGARGGLGRRAEEDHEVLKGREPLDTDVYLSLIGGGLGRRVEVDPEALEGRSPLDTDVYLSLIGGGLGRRAEVGA